MQRLRPYLWAGLATAVAVLCRSALTPLLGSALPFITLFPAVFVSAYVGGFGPAAMTTALGILASLYWFIHPYHLSLDDPISRVGVGLFGINGSFYDFTAERFRGTAREQLSAPPEDWGGRAIVDWVTALCRRSGFDPAAGQLVEVAAVVDRIYGRPTAEVAPRIDELAFSLAPASTP
jgi:hypothetical protein